MNTDFNLAVSESQDTKRKISKNSLDAKPLVSKRKFSQRPDQ